MKYIILFLLVSSVAIANLLESNEGNSIVINYENENMYSENQFLIIGYDEDIGNLPPSIPDDDMRIISEVNDISEYKQTKEGYYFIGLNKDLKKFKIEGLRPEKRFILHFITRNMVSDTYVGAIRGTTNALEPQNNPTDFRYISEGKDQLTVDWTQTEGAEGSILIVSKDRLPQLPKDSEIYKSNTNYGTDYSVIDGITYALFIGKKSDEPIIIDNLKDDGEYYFQVFSYNGNKYNKNYNIEINHNNTFVYKKKGDEK